MLVMFYKCSSAPGSSVWRRPKLWDFFNASYTLANLFVFAICSAGLCRVKRAILSSICFFDCLFHLWCNAVLPLQRIVSLYQITLVTIFKSTRGYLISFPFLWLWQERCLLSNQGCMLTTPRVVTDHSLTNNLMWTVFWNNFYINNINIAVHWKSSTQFWM